MYNKMNNISISTSNWADDDDDFQCDSVLPIIPPKEEGPGVPLESVRVPPFTSYKTKMCRFGIHCRVKEKCTFAHSNEELRQLHVERLFIPYGIIGQPTGSPEVIRMKNPSSPKE